MDKQWWSKKKLWQGAIVLVTFFCVCLSYFLFFYGYNKTPDQGSLQKKAFYVGARGSRGLEAPANMAGRELGSKEAGMMLEQ